MKSAAFALLALFALDAVAAIRWAPRDKLFPRTAADPRESRMVFSTRSHARWDATVANYFTFVSATPETPEDDSLPWVFGMEGGGFFTLRREDARFPLESVDGMFGLYWEALAHGLRYQLRLQHVSAHLADGTDTTVAIPYTREFFQGRIAWGLAPGFDLYAGVQYLLNRKPERPKFGAQLGAQGVLPSPWVAARPFLAVDAKWRGETKRDPSLSTQLGVAFGTSGSLGETLRVFYGFYKGADPRGQFWDQELEAHMVGLEMDF